MRRWIRWAALSAVALLSPSCADDGGGSTTTADGAGGADASADTTDDASGATDTAADTAEDSAPGDAAAPDVTAPDATPDVTADSVADADSGTGDTTPPDSGADGGADTGEPILPPGCDVLVTRGDDDQAALQGAFIDATEGQTICLAAGTFTLTSELSLAVAGVTVEELAIRNTSGDGLRADAVSGLTLRHLDIRWDAVESADNGGYALYPVQSDDVLIEGCVTVGASDTGVYVGQSTNVLVTGNEAFGNVAGIEIENTTDAEVVGNDCHDNAAGILVFNLPDLPIQDGKRANVHDNLVHDNNGKNFATAGNIVAMVPSGTGIMILASDANEVHANTIEDNQTAGVLIIHYASLLFGEVQDEEFDRYPEGNWVHDNTFSGNGDNPQGVAAALPLGKPIPPLAWDGCIDPDKEPTDALRNCFSGNGEAGFVDFDLCNDFASPSNDLGAVTCEHSPLPAVSANGAAE